MTRHEDVTPGFKLVLGTGYLNLINGHNLILFSKRGESVLKRENVVRLGGVRVRLIAVVER